ncbi:MAG: ABC transporter ATP-binding protein [Chloroflexaceae bacterium]|nr:ABC transporter ATP-binding protein [Chloroflexaceae bacterium]NJO08031.1 ABC transporter ATP-binding protein [Chloroflexaceae bacterium]
MTSQVTTLRREFTVTDEYQYDRRSTVRWILSHILRYPQFPIIAISGALVSNASLSYASVLIGQAFDLILRPDVTGDQIGGFALLVLGVYLGVGLFGLCSAYGFEFIAQRLERDTREELYISLLGKSLTFHNRQQVGDLMARATNDVQQMNLMINPGVGLIFDSFMSAIMPIIAIALLDVQLLLVPLIFMVSFLVALVFYTRELGPISGELQGQFGDMNAGLAESISGIEVVKAYAQEAAEERRFVNSASRYRDLFIKQGIVQARYLPLLFFGIAYGLAFGHALILFQAGALTPGDVVAFMGLMGLLGFPTFISLFSFVLVQLGLAGADRILSIINTDTELDENVQGYSSPMRGELVFENVSFGYSDAPLLKNISFRANPGETVAIVGQTGSGKTTLTRLVNRTYDATAGRVLIDGMDVREWSMQSLRSQISTIEQDIFLFSRTIAENIAFGAAGNATREQIEQAAREAQAHEFITSFPNGYDTLVGERGVTLSGGQRQRIAIARAFLTNPRILILDDSTSAIDSATEDQIQRAMRRILSGRTTLLITHRISQIRWADRILVLKHGELVAQGTHNELMLTSEAYRRIFARYE